jgi:hypothetical protein
MKLICSMLDVTQARGLILEEVARAEEGAPLRTRRSAMFDMIGTREALT